jgi:hypothetical protein
MSSDFTPQSSDQLSGTTTPQRSAVILEGSATLTLTHPAAGTLGSATVLLPVTAQSALLKAEGSIAVAFGGGVIVYYQFPFAIFSNTTGALARSGNMTFSGPTKNGVTLNIDILEASTGDFSTTVYYRVLALGISTL